MRWETMAPWRGATRSRPREDATVSDRPHAELLDRHRRVMPSWLALYYDEPIELVSGEGRHVVDGEGTRYLDFFGGILTTMTGYDVPEVVDAIRTQAGRMIHTSTLYLIRPMVELAERLAPLSGIPDAKVFFTTSGTEANEAALLLASTARRVEPGARPAQQLSRPVVRHGGHHRQPGLVGVEPHAVHRPLRRRRAPLPRRRRPPCPRRRSSPPPSTTCAT